MSCCLTSTFSTVPGLLLLGASRVLLRGHARPDVVDRRPDRRTTPAAQPPGRAATAVYVGTSAALVVGNPMTTWLSQAWGWRPTVGAVAVAAAVVAVLAGWRCCAHGRRHHRCGTECGARAVSQPRLITLCVLTTIGVSAHFASYTFIVPIVRDVVGVGGHDENWLLGAYGIAGLVTMVVLACAVDRRPFTTVIGSLSAPVPGVSGC